MHRIYTLSGIKQCLVQYNRYTIMHLVLRQYKHDRFDIHPDSFLKKCASLCMHKKIKILVAAN